MVIIIAGGHLPDCEGQMRFFRSKGRVFTAGVAAAIFCLSMPAQAKSVKEYEAMAPADQDHYVVSFLEKMTYDIARKNPELAQQIKDYFVHDQPGKQFSAGLEQLEVELAAIDRLAKQGKADRSKIEVEGVIVYVTKRHFASVSAGT